MFELFHVTGNRGQTEVFSQIDHPTLEKAHDTLRCSLSDSYKTDFTPSRILQDHQKKLDTQLALVLDILSALFHDIMLAKLLVSNFAQSILNKALNLTTAVTLLMGGNLTPY